MRVYVKLERKVMGKKTMHETEFSGTNAQAQALEYIHNLQPCIVQVIRLQRDE